MEKTIKIGNKNIKMRTSAAIPRLYRDNFNRDVFKDISVLYENSDNITYDMFELIENFAYLLAKHAGEDMPDTVAE